MHVEAVIVESDISGDILARVVIVGIGVEDIVGYPRPFDYVGQGVGLVDEIDHFVVYDFFEVVDIQREEVFLGEDAVGRAGSVQIGCSHPLIGRASSPVSSSAMSNAFFRLSALPSHM